jgi:cytochrome c biogenesis protein CcmG/thiol:disulfide interchange protein DsbE
VITQQHGDKAADRSTRLPRPRRHRKITYIATVAIVAAAAALVVSLAGGQAKKPAGPPPEARNFSLAQLGHAGGSVALAAYAGHPVIVNFFASWCPPCQRETPMLAQFYLSMHGRVTVLGIDSNDQRTAALHFLARTGARYPVGFDPLPSATTTSYGVLALPQTFFLNAQHRIVSHIVGPLTMKDLARGVALMDKNRG